MGKRDASQKGGLIRGKTVMMVAGEKGNAEIFNT
jgi:hypothetical protein